MMKAGNSQLSGPAIFVASYRARKTWARGWSRNRTADAVTINPAVLSDGTVVARDLLARLHFFDVPSDGVTAPFQKTSTPGNRGSAVTQSHRYTASPTSPVHSE